MSCFITNQQFKSLQKRIETLILNSIELKFLVGYFYFSGIKEFYEELKTNSQVILKVLVGLDADLVNNKLIEIAFDKAFSDEDKFLSFLNSIKRAINSEFFDNKEFYEQVRFFVQLIKDDRLIIRKTNRPNHSKLYLFYLNENQIGRNKLFITGSSNLTAPGIAKRDEFNVEISDFGFAEAEKYFDDLWNDAVLITEHEEYKKELIHTIENETLVKQISPFEAYCYVIKNYLETFRPQSLKESIIKLFEDKGYKRYKYQLDAISLALSIIEKYNGVLISDVVELGKTIIACAVA